MIDLILIEKQHFHSTLQRKDLLQFLIHIQSKLGWIDEPNLRWCANRVSSNDTPISAEEIRGIIDFYSFLHRTPMPRLHLYLSSSITDYMLGQQANYDFFIKLQQSHPEHFKVSLTSCTGLCDQGPAGLLNGIPIPCIDKKVQNTLKSIVEGNIKLAELADHLPPIKDNIQKPDQLLQQQLKGGEALKKAVKLKPQEFLEQVKTSNLRGRGGAGFPTGVKWQTCRQAQSNAKAVICNADEGEPGTFKDRVLLSRHLEQVIDGMTIAAYTVGANLGFIYLRYEYQYLLPHIETAICNREKQNLLGQNILGIAGFDFSIEVHLGAGAYICGEESALIESLEGKRGIPRIRPPFPAESGYLGLPTIVNNVETFCCISEIALTSGSKFSQKACEGSTGTKIHSVSGDCAKPGIYELPFDTTIQDVLNLSGAVDTQAVQVGGPSGKLLFPKDFSEKINFSHVSSGGSFIVFNNSRDLFAVVKNFTDFFHHESCGFCTPCRVGCGILSETLERFAKGLALDDEIHHLEDMMNLMDVASHCGLGQTASHPVRYLLQEKPELFKQKEQKNSVLKINVAELTSEASALIAGGRDES